MPKVLLWNKGEREFGQFMQQGLARLMPDDIQLLYKFEAVEAAGVPDLFAHAFMFSRQLEKSNHQNQLPAFQQFSTLVKGVFLNTLTLTPIPMQELGFWGSVAKEFQATQPVMEDFTLLRWRGEIVGGIYPECLVFPGAQVSQETLNEIQTDNQAQERKFGSGVVLALFTQWVHAMTDSFRRNGEPFPLWANRLQNMIDGWGTSPVPSNYQLITVHDVFLSQIDRERLPAENRMVPLRQITLQGIGTGGLEDIFCQKVVRFKNGKLPDFPVRLDYIDQVQTDAQHTFEPTIKTENGKQIATYQVFLKGENQPSIEHEAEIIDGDEASILLWPSFTAPDWNVNYVLFHASDTFKNHQPSIQVKMRNGDITMLISGSAVGRQQLPSPMAAIPISENSLVMIVTGRNRWWIRIGIAPKSPRKNAKLF